MILSLQTADHTTTLGLFADATTPSPTAELHWDSGRDLSDQLLSHLTAFLNEHNANLKALTGLIIFSGPGSFTSLRIGHTVANALADSLNLPIAGATGSDWQTAALAALSAAKPGRPILPHYGTAPHITKPKS